MLRRRLPLLVLFSAGLSLAGCESATRPPLEVEAPPFRASQEYAAMVSTLLDLYDRALRRGYSGDDILRAAAAGETEADQRLFGLTGKEARQVVGRIDTARADLERRYPELKPPPPAFERVQEGGKSAKAPCRWVAAGDALFSCARGGDAATYVGCALVTWANYCVNVEFSYFLKNVGYAGGGAR